MNRAKSLLVSIFFLVFFVLTVFAYGADWTVMMYLDGDNNLENAAISDINEMEAAGGSNSNVNIVVLIDRISGYDSSNGDWTDTRRGLIINDSNPDIIASPLESVGEKNMGDPATLSEFVSWAKSTYPASHYALILWDHGDGWSRRRVSLPENIKDIALLEASDFPESAKSRAASLSADSAVDDGKPVKGICVDETNGGDVLKMSEVRSALEFLSQKIDIIAYDACLMGMMEVAYEMKDRALIHVGSEETIPTAGFPYNLFLRDLLVNPAMSGTELATAMVKRYGESYAGGETLSAINLLKIANVNQKLDNFSKICFDLDDQYINLEDAKYITNNFYIPNYYDLKNFLSNFVSKTDSLSAAAAANETIAAINDAVIANHSALSLNGTGLSIYLIGMGGTVSPSYSSSTILFPGDNYWDELIKRLSSYAPSDDRFEENDTSDVATTVTLGLQNSLKCFDYDWYSIKITKPGQYLFSVNHSNELGDIDLYLYKRNESDNSLSSVANGLSYSNTEAIYVDVGEPSTFVMLARPYKNNTYSLEIIENRLNEGMNVSEIPFEWNDISTSGTAIIMGDDVSAAQNIGFDFPLFNRKFSMINVSSNGYISFDSLGGDLYINEALTVPNSPNGVIAPFWDDLYPDRETGVYYKSEGQGTDDERFIIQWNNVGHYIYGGNVSAGRISFQAILYKTGAIDFVYKDLFFADSDTMNYGKSATVGVDSYSGFDGYVYSFNNPLLHDEMSLRWTFGKNPAASVVNSYNFDLDEEGWISGGLPSGMGVPSFGYSQTALTVNPNGMNVFGYWQSPQNAIPASVSGSLYTVSALMKSNIPQCQVPIVRLRANSYDFSQASVLTVNSMGDCDYAPDDSYKNYSLYFEPENKGAGKDYIIAVDLLNIDENDSTTGTLFIDSVDIYRTPLTSLSGKLIEKDYDFELSSEGWNHSGAIPGLTSPIFDSNSGALLITSQNNTNTFGFWNNNASEIKIAPEKIYRITYNLKTSLESGDEMFMFRGRVFSEDYQSIMTYEAPYVNFEATPSSSYVHHLYFAPPQHLPKTEQNGMGIALDMLNISEYSPEVFTMSLESLNVESFFIPDFSK